MDNDLIIAGASAQGHGVLVGWSGDGTLTRSMILDVLARVGLPASLAPAPKSEEAIAARAVAHVSAGYVSVRAPSLMRHNGTRAYRVRWTLSRREERDDSAYAVEPKSVTVELLDGDSKLHVRATDPYLAQQCRDEYDRLIAGEIYTAGDVSTWLSGVLRDHMGAARYSLGWYIERRWAECARDLVAALAPLWGAQWTSPPLPVATGPELVSGVQSGLVAEVAGVTRALAAARRALPETRTEISSTVASRLLGDLIQIADRTARMEAIMATPMLGARAALESLRATLAPLADDTSTRFALLEIPDVIEAPAVAEVSPAERAADAALAARRGAGAHPVSGISSAYFAAAADPFGGMLELD